jgi:hypothetical protein
VNNVPRRDDGTDAVKKTGKGLFRCDERGFDRLQPF